MISITILAKDSEETIEGCLSALKSFPEVIFLDTGSKDRTLEMARRFPNVKIFSSPFTGFGPLHNLACEKATHEWILSIDSDEILSPEAVKEIQALTLNPKHVYSFPFYNFFAGKHIRTCGWHPERKIRLFHKGSTKFSEDHIHEKILTDHLTITPLNGTIHHFSYRKIDDFLTKMQRYSSLFVEQSRGKRKSSLTKALFKSWTAFFRSYILKKGFLGGREGYVISRYNADVAYYKYLKLAYENKE